jgi:hypothetical protein
MQRQLMAGAFAALVLGFWCGRAEAATNFVAVQTPAPNAPVTMGTTGTLTYRITNSNTGGDTDEHIYEIRFRMSSGRSTFSSTTAAPAGWTRTAYSTTSVTFRANSWANTIATGSFRDFAIVFNFRSTTGDTNELLRDIRARTTNDTVGPPFDNDGSDTDSNQGGWTLKSLALTMQITDLGGTPITSLNAGGSFRLVMTVTNRSSSSKTSIVSVNSPPNTNETGTVTQGNPSPVYSPNPLTLAAGATGTITFTYGTNVNDSGTISFTAYVRNNTSSATSATVTSPILSVGRFSANVTVVPTCQYNGSDLTVTMTLTNNYSNNIINVTPTLIPLGGSPVTWISGPTPAPPNGPVPPGGGTFVFQWVYRVTGSTPGQTFTFSGSATGTEQTTGNPRSTPSSTSNTIAAAGYTVAVIPDETNASSTNGEIIWAIQNQGCSPIVSVAIGIPAGWTWSGDSHSLVDANVTTSVETWTVSGSNPVTFTAPIVADQLFVTGDGEYRLTFSATPGSTGVSTFPLTITHASGVVNTIPSTVTVNAFGSGGLNDAPGLIWQEQFR